MKQKPRFCGRHLRPQKPRDFVSPAPHTAAWRALILMGSERWFPPVSISRARTSPKFLVAGFGGGAVIRKLNRVHEVRAPGRPGFFVYYGTEASPCRGCCWTGLGLP